MNIKKILTVLFTLLVTITITTGCKNEKQNTNKVEAAIVYPPDRGFLYADGMNIVDKSGTPVILRGMGFGGWMIQEPYMLSVQEECPGGQHVIFTKVKEVLGEKKFEIYRKAWLANYCTEQDVIALKEAGFNSLRLPIHYNLFTLSTEDEESVGTDTWLEEGFALTDQLLEWCRRHGIFLIIDLHAAPGGQGKDANICDYDPLKPSLWENEENQRKTVALWQKIAERYANEPWIGGYDLLNETNWTFEKKHPHGIEDTKNIPLKQLTQKIITAIRKVDSNHLIFIEGNSWGNNHAGMWPISDDNIALSFHKYWNPNRVEEIQHFIDLSEEYNVPLWMGEAGENSSSWNQDAVTLLEEHNIGWAWWTWKKIGPKLPGSGKEKAGYPGYSIKKPENYTLLELYWDGIIEKPNEKMAFETLMELTENLKIENCRRNSETIESLFPKNRQDNEK